mmetsp:Transcript_54168/g.86117  ORF Transcript_54168/g.86117 Transcript_54168/m.86117 type:complete len:89 (-) Transcript_54168:85-351(-)
MAEAQLQSKETKLVQSSAGSIEKSATAPGKEPAAESSAFPTVQIVTYICGNCGLDVEVKPSDAIRCRECGYRILFKKRCKKPMQYQAI